LLLGRVLALVLGRVAALGRCLLFFLAFLPVCLPAGHPVGDGGSGTRDNGRAGGHP